MNEFLNAIKQLAQKFKKLEGKPVRIIGHLDADGLSSSAIVIRALQREGIKYALTTIRQLDDIFLDELTRENYPVVIFLDLGSGTLNKIETALRGREIFVLDHHVLEDYNPRDAYVVMLNEYSVAWIPA